MVVDKFVALKVKCHTRGDTGPACNAAGMIDRTILGIQHLYRKPIYARTEVNLVFETKTCVLLPCCILFSVLNFTFL